MFPLRKLACCLLPVLLTLPAAAADLGSMQPSEIEAMQHRLTDAKCYSGPIDGRTSAGLIQAIGACPPQDPQLRIETGMHVAPIKRIGVDRDCRIAATASDDKTVRLWSLPGGRLLRTLRWPIAPGAFGKVYATAVSPDGRYVAIGGADARWSVAKTVDVSVFDAAAGTLIARTGAFDDVINHLVFSPDGHWLAVTLSNNGGVRVIDTATWTQVAADAAYKGDSYGATFGPDGRLYTVALDGTLRRYGPGPAFLMEQQVTARSGKQPSSISVDPSGHLLAVAFVDAARVDLYDAGTLAFRLATETKGVDNRNLSSAAWLSDGTGIAAGGMYEVLKDGRWKRPILIFGRNGRRISTAPPTADNTIFSVQACGDGIAVSTGDPAFGLLDTDGRARLWKVGVAPDLRDMGDGFALSDDAKRVRFGLAQWATRPMVFDLAAATLAESPEAPAGLVPARTAGLPIARWRHDTPAFAGKRIALDPYESTHSLAIRPDRAGFVLGADFSVRSFDAGGRQRWQQPAGSIAWGVNLTPDGRIIVAAYADGTIRWHRWSDGQELLALFVNKDTKAWVAWTPSGYYMASPGGEDMIGWHVNRGWDQAADFFPASRFREKYSRPDIVQLVLDTLDEAEAVRQANATARRRDDTRPVIERLPPVLTILSPADGAQVATGSVQIRYGVRSPSGAPVDRIEAFVDGAKVEARGLAGPDGATGTITLPMPAHDVAISLVAYAGALAGDAVRVELRGSGAAPSADGDLAKPTLFALLVGVSQYQDADLDLGYAAKDATELAETLKAQSGRLYGSVEVKVLTDEDATATGVKDGLAWLAAHATDRDLELFFVAGHGLTDAKGTFWFLTHETDPVRISSTALSRDDITRVLYDLPGKKLMFLDACHSGAALDIGTRGLGRVDVNAAVNDFAQAEGGIVAYAASTGREVSYERAEWGHGAFTKALIEGLGGKADLLHKGTITTATLDAFLEDRVKELTNGQQHPVMNRPKTVPDFPIALTH